MFVERQTGPYLPLENAETAEAEEYTMPLALVNWYMFCDSLNGTLRTAMTWHILKAILDPTKTKGEGHRAL